MSHLFIFGFVYVSLGVGLKKFLQWFMAKTVLPMFWSNSFRMSSLTFKSRNIYINNYLKCKWIKCFKQKTQTSWINTKQNPEAEGKRELERYTQMSAEFQRIARRDKKAFLNEQCKEIEEKLEWERLEIFSRILEILWEHFI